MTIMESAIAMNHDYLECENSLGRINLFAEAAYEEYKINLKEVALKVLKENGTEEDFDFLATEAANNFIDRAKKAIGKIIDAVLKFIRGCRDKIASLFTNKKTKEALEKAEKACENNPKLRSQKIEYHNTEKQIKVAQEGIDKIRKKHAKIKAKGKATENDIEEIREIKSNTMKKIGAISAIATIPFVAAIALLMNPSKREKIVIGTENVPGEREWFIDAEDVEVMNAVKEAVSAVTDLQKTQATLGVDSLVSLTNGIKNATQSKDLNIDDEKLEKESPACLEDLEMFAIVTESVEEEVAEVEEKVEETEETPVVESAGVQEGLDLDAYFNEMCDELFTTESAETEEVETKEENEVEEHVEESAEESEEESEFSALTYMESMEAELFGEEENVETESTETETEPEVDSATYMESLEKELFGEEEEVETESAENESNDSTTYMETLERELFGEEEIATESSENEEVKEEATETVEEDVAESTRSLLDEMEDLLN